MKEYYVRLESNSKYCMPLQCSCGSLLIILKPTVTVPIRTSSSAFAQNIIIGTVASVRFLDDIDRDGKMEWDYTIQYNENDLIDSSYSLNSCDIETMCCKNCELNSSIAYTDKKIADLQAQITALALRVTLLETPN